MANKSGKAYALTVISPIKNGHVGNLSCALETLKRCTDIRLHEDSPFAKVPNTYLARLFVLDNVYYESMPANDKIFNFADLFSIVISKLRLKALPKHDQLKSKYLVFSSNFHGDLDTYLGELWDKFRYVDFTDDEQEGDKEHDISYLWEHCVAFDQVKTKPQFIEYIKKCQLDASLFFNGSNDESLAEQLKALYLKQEFTRFAIEHQGVDADKLQSDFQAFIERVQPDDLSKPTWVPGQSTLGYQEK